MHPDQLKHFLHKLKAEKESLLNQISAIETSGIGDTMSDSVGELSVYDNHPADIGSELFERSKDIALRDNAHVLLEDVEKALEKFVDGTYGTCETCGKWIEMERLEEIPWANKCAHCQHDSEKKDSTPRPLEEEIISPPFHRTFLDSSPENFVGFDGEDALQSVMKFGSSDTPQDIPGTYNYKALFPNSNEHSGIVDRTDAIPNPATIRSKKNVKT